MVPVPLVTSSRPARLPDVCAVLQNMTTVITNCKTGLTSAITSGITIPDRVNYSVLLVFLFNWEITVSFTVLMSDKFKID